MNALFTKLGSKAGQLLAKSVFKAKAASPEILVGAGIVAVVAGTVVACKQTIKAKAILDEHKKAMAETEEALELSKITVENEDGTVTTETYTEADYKNDRKIIRIQTGWKLVKTYAVPFVIEAGGIACILASHGIMRKRNAMLMAAYEGLQAAYIKYQDRVKEKYGEEAHEDILFGDRVKEKVLQKKEDSDVYEEIEQSGRPYPMNISPYAKFFDERSRNYQKTPNLNYSFLVAQQKFANWKLRERGFLFLNEVYEALDIPMTPEGQMMGWLFDRSIGGDSQVSFGIFKNGNDQLAQSARDFVNGYERSILLDFNVDPKPIYNRI